MSTASTAAPRFTRFQIAILALALLPLVACEPDCRPQATPARPNVVLITIDTLRADYLGTYGSTTTRTPSIDRIGGEGATFDICYAQSNVTVPSHLTIMSSLPVTDHGVLGNGRPLPAPITTLPQIMAEAGYRSAAIVSAKHLGPEFAVGQALTTLEHYHAPRRLSEPALADETNRELFRWIRSTCAAPFFAWVHYWDPHMPYTPPRPFDRMYYDDDPYAARHTSMEGVTQAWHHYERRPLSTVLKDHRDEVGSLQAALGVDRPTLHRLILERGDLAPYVSDPAAMADIRARLDALAAVVRRSLPLQPNLASWLTDVRDLHFARAQYAGEISYVDRAVGTLRTELEQLGIADRTVLVITGDHGESLGEHGIYFGHAGLYDTTLRVPLVIWAPGRVPAGRHPEPARSLDIAPTILGLVGLPAPSTMQGRDLLDSDRAYEEVISVANHGRQMMVRDGRWKLIRTVDSFYYVDGFAPRAGDRELYDLENDPTELVNLATRHPDITARLDGVLDAWLAKRAADGAPAAHLRPGASGLSREQRDGLRALGYVE